jgi:hypothetical protein
MQLHSRQSLKPKALQSDGVKLIYAPCVEDPDPPDFMSDAEILAAAKAIAEHMGWSTTS